MTHYFQTADFVMKKLLLVFLVMAMVSACTWVKLTPAGEKVRVAGANQVVGCKKLGQTQTMLKDKIAGIKRDADKVRSEMETLARNSAAEMNGDTVVPVSGIEDGKQVFDVYSCGYVQ
jgi:hypothetical protein